MVILIIGVLAMIAVPRFADNKAFAERGYHEELVAALRFAQKYAVASGCPVRFAVTGTAYSGRQQPATGGRCDTGSPVFSIPMRLADGTTLDGSAPAGVTASPVTVIFDALGRTGLAGDTTVTVGSHAFTIHAASGHVEVP